MARLGMDTVVVRADAAQMDRLAEQLHALVGSINGSVGHMSASWLGPDAEQLVHRWQRQSRPAIEALAVQVHRLASIARDEAHAQEVTSGGATSTNGTTSGGTASIGRQLSIGPITREILALFPGAALALINANKSWDAAGRWHKEASVGAAGATTVGGVPMSGDVSARAWADADYAAHAGLSRHGAEASAAASVGVGAAVAANGRIGNRYASATGHAGATAEARADASGNASVGLNGAKAHGELKAFAGAHADADAHADLGGVGAGAGVSGYAGIGVHADVDAALTWHEAKASVDVGAALGLGAGVKVSIDVHPDEVADNVMGLLGFNRK